MKQFIYSPSVVGRDHWPPGELRLQGIEATADPAQADVFVVPGGLRLFPMAHDLQMLPYFKGNEPRHVLFDVSDDEQLYGLPCIFFRGNVRTWYFEQDPNSVSLAWPVRGRDFEESIKPPPNGFKYDLSFQGWVTSHDTREESTAACLATEGLKCDFALYRDFYGYLQYNDPERERRQREHARSLKESRIALCPESINGVFPYRFFEAMAAGRVPLLIGTDFVFPFADKIPYQDFIIQCPRAARKYAGDMARQFIAKHSDEDIISLGQMGRMYWEAYLNAEDWPTMMASVVRERIEKLCTSPS